MTCNYSKRQLENGPISIYCTVITFLTAELLPKLEVLGFKCCRLYLTAHRIVLKDDIPVYVPPRRMSPPAAEEIERQCLDLERLGIIERCDSAWSAPVVPVRKKDGSLRLCIDYRRLSKQTVATRFPMADVNDIVYSAHGMKFFATLDLAKGYYQVPLEETSKDYTAFSTARQHWRFRR